MFTLMYEIVRFLCLDCKHPTTQCTTREGMASLTEQCSACKTTFAVRGSAPAKGCKPLCDTCEAAFMERTENGSALFRLTRAVLRKPVPFIQPPPPPADLKAKRKAFLRAVMKRTKALGLQAFKADKRVHTVKDYIELATVYAPKHPTRVLVLWMDMNVPWCVDHANMHFSQLGETGAYDTHWVCFHRDSFCKGSFHRGTEFTMKVFDSMIENAGKPAPPCDICSKPVLDSVMCVQCNKELCSLCRDRWHDKCRKSGHPTTCPFCRHPYEVEERMVNLDGILSDLKE